MSSQQSIITVRHAVHENHHQVRRCSNGCGEAHISADESCLRHEQSSQHEQSIHQQPAPRSASSQKEQFCYCRELEAHDLALLRYLQRLSLQGLLLLKN